MITARDALARLREGNRRFVAGARSLDSIISQARRSDLLEGQKPFAAVLGCSDSRVPVELIFDQGPGDLFVIRVAGNIVAPSLIGSVEFAAVKFETRLVVVLGHSDCGAVHATIESVGHPLDPTLRNLRSIVDRIRPSVETVRQTSPHLGREELAECAIRANIRASADHLRHGSDILEQLIQQDGLLIVGAEYSLESGVVEFFDGVPPAA